MVLVIRRRVDEKFVLQHPAFGQAEITVYALENKRVKLGINAPRSVNIVRSELLEKTEQGEESDHTGYWLKADREEAKSQARSFGRSYIEDLEAIARLADEFWTKMVNRAMSPEEAQLADQLLDALAEVNFLAEIDDPMEEDAQRELEVAHAV